MGYMQLPVTRDTDRLAAADDVGMLSVDVLGPILVGRGGVPIAVGPAMIRNLLAVLALQPGRSVPRDDIVDLLWDGDPPATYVNLVQVYVSRLRAQLRDRGRDDQAAIVVSDRRGYRLDVDAATTDLFRFERLCAEAHRLASSGDAATSVDRYAAALSCWRGPVLVDCAPKFGRHPLVVAADQQRLEAAVAYARLCCRLERHTAAVKMLWSVAHEASMHEGLYTQLMLALWGTGDRAAALTAYQDIRRRLADELGVDPGGALQAAYLQVLRDGAAKRYPPPGADRGATRPKLPIAVRVTDGPPFPGSIGQTNR
jgi:DNA-binding SARP family transcriptional activator